jgi:hypothetical protein
VLSALGLASTNSSLPRSGRSCKHVNSGQGRWIAARVAGDGRLSLRRSQAEADRLGVAWSCSVAIAPIRAQRLVGKHAEGAGHMRLARFMPIAGTHHAGRLGDRTGAGACALRGLGTPAHRSPTGNRPGGLRVFGGSGCDRAVDAERSGPGPRSGRWRRRAVRRVPSLAAEARSQDAGRPRYGATKRRRIEAPDMHQTRLLLSRESGSGAPTLKPHLEAAWKRQTAAERSSYAQPIARRADSATGGSRPQ